MNVVVLFPVRLVGDTCCNTSGSFLGAGNVQTGMDRSPSSTSITRNHSATGLGDGNGDHPKVSDSECTPVMLFTLFNNIILFSQGNTHFMRKIPQGAEASNILVGQVNFLEKPLSAFIRLNQGTFLGDLTEVPVPTRFLFILLGPTVSVCQCCFLCRDSFSSLLTSFISLSRVASPLSTRSDVPWRLSCPTRCFTTSLTRRRIEIICWQLWMSS